MPGGGAGAVSDVQAGLQVEEGPCTGTMCTGFFVEEG